MLPQQVNEFGHAKTLMANFQCVPQWHFYVRAQVGAIIQPMIMAACQPRGRFCVARQQFKKSLQALVAPPGNPDWNVSRCFHDIFAAMLTQIWRAASNLQ